MSRKQRHFWRVKPHMNMLAGVESLWKGRIASPPNACWAVESPLYSRACVPSWMLAGMPILQWSSERYRMLFAWWVHSWLMAFEISGMPSDAPAIPFRPRHVWTFRKPRTYAERKSTHEAGFCHCAVHNKDANECMTMSNISSNWSASTTAATAKELCLLQERQLQLGFTTTLYGWFWTQKSTEGLHLLLVGALFMNILWDLLIWHILLTPYSPWATQVIHMSSSAFLRIVNLQVKPVVHLRVARP